MKTALKIILHLAGFPLLIALIVVFTLPVIQAGITYGVMVFVGLIVAVVMALIYFLVYFLMAKRGKKTIARQTLVSIIVAVVCLGGLWIAVDNFLPDILKDATSNTILYEDLADDYGARAEVNKNLLEEFIRRNVANGSLLTQEEVENCIKENVELEILVDLPEAEYLAQGPKNPEVAALLREEFSARFLEEGARNQKVRDLISTKFQSIDKDGYVTFVGPWLDMANDERLTIPTLIHLIVNKRETEALPFPMYGSEDAVQWSILDMLGEPMEFDLGPNGMNVVPENLVGTIDFASAAVNSILAYLTYAIEDPDVVGSPIFITWGEGGVISLIPSNESRGVLDYQRMAWLDSNGLIFAIVSLFSVRKLFLIFAGVLVVTTYLIGMLRDDGKKSAKEAKVYSDDPQGVGPVLDMNNLTTDFYKPYDPSYVVVTRGNLDYDKISRQLAEDAANGVTKVYLPEDFA